MSRGNLVARNELRPCRETGQEYSFFGISFAKGMDLEPWGQKESHGDIRVYF